MTILVTANHQPWKTVTATVTSVEAKHGLSRTLETDDNPERSFYVVQFRYTVDGHPYDGSFESRGPLERGQEIRVLYNPDDPRQNSESGPVETHTSRTVFWIILAVVVVVMLFIAFSVFGR